MKKILVEGYFAKNFGDDLFFKVLFERYEDIKWVINTNNKSYTKIFSAYKNVEIKNKFYNKIFRKIKINGLGNKTIDAVVFIGGSIFMENEGWNEIYSYRDSIFKSFDKKPIFFIGCNFGPFSTMEFVEKNKALFEKSADVCFRDQYSGDIFKLLPNTRVAPDIIFGLKTKKIESIRNTLGISVINLNGRKDLQEYQETYMNKMLEIIMDAINRNLKVTLFSFCEDEGDMEIIEKIVESIDFKYRDNIDIVNYEGDIENFLNRFKEMENIVGTRFHACILSQVFGQGLYPIIYSNKTYNVLKDINLTDNYAYIKDIEQLKPKHVLDIISSNKINDTKIFSDAEKQFQSLDEYIRAQDIGMSNCHEHI